MRDEICNGRDQDAAERRRREVDYCPIDRGGLMGDPVAACREGVRLKAG